MPKINIEPPAKGAGDTSDDGPLYAAHQKVYPAKVKGRYRRLKWVLLFVFLGIYYLLPWLKWSRGENTPDQAVLIDLVGRRFFFFGIEVWPQEVFLFAALLVIAALGLFFITSLAGRVWCGYACPQTVWTDLFTAVEHWLEGDRVKRQRLDAAPWSLRKLRIKIAKHSLWLLIGLATGGTVVFYFTDAYGLLGDILSLNAPYAVVFWSLFFTLTTYVLAGHVREHVCTYMCPYARFQGAMFDEHTLVVSYDEARGEPRGSHKAGDSWEGRGDCVDCGRCVAVCPVGIDIREGQQYQCITCALCVDACNEIMDKVGRPRGLIRYDTLANMRLRAVGKESNQLHLLRPRTLIYGAVLLVVGLATLYGFTFGQKQVELNIIRDRNPLFIQMSDGGIRNAYTLHVLNKTGEAQKYQLTQEGIPSALISLARENRNKTNTLHLEVPAQTVNTYRLFVDAPAQARLNDHTPVTFRLSTEKSSDSYTSVFISPEK